jgi:hypothetical protein
MTRPPAPMAISCSRCGGEVWALLTSCESNEQLTLCLGCYHRWSWPKNWVRFRFERIRGVSRLVACGGPGTLFSELPLRR